MNTQDMHRRVKQIVNAASKLMLELEEEMSAEEDRKRIEAEYNRISEERDRFARNAPVPGVHDTNVGKAADGQPDATPPKK